ncbi:U3 small nucleolar RNA-associated protein 17 [Lachnellula cervina]|uniref:U3 small nucleolar RNA-associated protein 17 n=1 Tax=Lachnellula cervina TaxID=1316786 RepID=A0A7D8ZEL2_9HELO|nr:U3 small nucleolar RNA-associated protein 17 [Lachnellula cervina]
MASALKRKRGPVEVLDAPKRSKSVKSETPKSLQKFNSQNVGWEAAFGAPPKIKDLVQTNGVNGEISDSEEDSVVSEALDFDALQEGDFLSNGRDTTSRKRALKAQDHSRTWKLSESIGGRMINANPAFTADEKYIIVASRTTVHIYSTSTSLLTRSIKLKIEENRPNARICTYCLSPTQPEILWVACSDGHIYSVNWTSGAGATQWWATSSTGCDYMTVASMESAGRRRDVVFTTEKRKDEGWRVTAHELAPPDGEIKIAARTIYTSNDQITFLTTAKEGAVVVGAAGKKLLLGRLRSTEYDTVDKIKFEFRVFETTDRISSLDLRASERTGTEALKKSILKKIPIVDLVIGDVRGAIFVHNDLLANLIRAQDGTLPKGISLTPRKLHWHRQEVQTVKWSLDGNYIISGGTETVLVLWQLDTGKQQFLPHMSATIQNVVVAPSGSSYGIQLADNSALILSTAELQPTTNIAGIQASVLGTSEDSKVWRLQDETWQPPLIQRTPAVINPRSPSQLLLAVGQTHEVNPQEPLVMSSPFLQTFDLGSGHNLYRQALTRTNITNINAAPSAHRLSEPRVTHMKISYDGTWLATVDEWTPPEHDLAFLGHQEKDLEVERRARREVFLKFWQWSSENKAWELVSRIDTPHTLSRSSSFAGRILDISADPSSLRFSTVGEDGVVCIWSTKTRKRDNVVVRDKGGKAFRNWHCQQAISLGKSELLDEPGSLDAPLTSGSVAFSEDGSVLAAACSSRDGVLHLVDPESGIIRMSQSGLFEGNIVKIDFLGQDLITLSDKLLVYDLVSNETRFGISLRHELSELSMEQKQQMMHLAVDQRSRTFSIALPIKAWSNKKATSLQHRHSELFVFHQDKARPQLKEIFPSIVTALLPAIDSEGYFVLDATAEIRTVHKKGSQVLTTLAQSTSALNLDVEPQESEGLLRLVDDVEEVEEMDEDQLPTPAATQDGNEDEDEDETPVVTQQQLSEVFDIGPSFALPPLEEMFYQVAGLFSSKPLA